jgi:phenylpropionate dioxygenase-like ring-hydroxylating dioxygenase large terminal subunit
MNSILTSNQYYENSFFEKEISEIFLKSWIYLGHLSEFKNNNDFKTISFKGRELVVQNFNGKLRCFLNVCSHRHSKIQIEKEGNRAFFCPYHGWAYNSKGIPGGIPKKPLFNYSKNDLDCLKLKSFDIAYCGDFIFASMDNCTTTLENYIGEYYSKLEKISKSIDIKIDVNRFSTNTNWKIIVENTLEAYHVNLIHENTFLKLGTSGMKFSFSGNHSSWITSMNKKINDSGNKRIFKYFSPTEYEIDGYEHILIFPNILISSTYGKSYNISRVDPISSTKSLFQSEVFVSKREVNTMTKLFDQQLIKFNRTVFQEDKNICEEVQKGTMISLYQGQLSEEEERVFHFQKSINSKILK